MSEEQKDIFRLSYDGLSVQEVVDAVSSASCGAVSVFIGTTREDEVDSRKVVGLEYEAYEPMAQSEFSRLCDDIRTRWPNVKWVKVGDASVVMAVSSPHRQDGQQAIQQGISQLKASIPIWKKEVYDSQEASWKENSECSWSSHAVQTKPAL
ncbi:molybdopterin synthase catalytic subunit isoform 2-T2 [Xenentodon cancila]